MTGLLFAARLFAQEIIKDQAVENQSQRMVYAQWDQDDFYPKAGFLDTNPYYWLVWGLFDPDYHNTDLRPLSATGPQTQRLALVGALNGTDNNYKLNSDTTRNTALSQIASQSGLLSDADPLWLLYYNQQFQPLLNYSAVSILGPLPPKVSATLLSDGLYNWYTNALAMLKERLNGARTTDMDRGSRIMAYYRMLKEYQELAGVWAVRVATFREQMAYLDSMNKANDPAIKAEKQKKDVLAKAEAERKSEPALSVHKAAGTLAAFNTVVPDKPDEFIKVVIDENLTDYAGSRIRLRLLDDITVGHYLIQKDTYLYALISGFSGQRVTLSVKSILYDGKILPVKLEVYDLDGLAGLYVPESAFRDFTKDLGTNTIEGVTIDNSGTGSATSQFVMSTADKMFESTSSAIAGLIRKNKANIKYNSYLYLIDSENTKNP